MISNFWLKFPVLTKRFFPFNTLYSFVKFLQKKCVCIRVECGSQTICRKRYKQAFQCYNQQFRKEIKQLEAMQPSAIDAMRVHRSVVENLQRIWNTL